MNQPEFVDTPAKTYMSEQEFIAHMDELIPTPSVETNNNLLDLANSLWWEMKRSLNLRDVPVDHYNLKLKKSLSGQDR